MQSVKVKMKNGGGLIKLQIPSTNHQGSSRFQPPILVLGDWIFSGAWTLELGFLGGVHVHSRNSRKASRKAPGGGRVMKAKVAKSR
jgi:hypothetical protein